MNGYQRYLNYHNGPLFGISSVSPMPPMSFGLGVGIAAISKLALILVMTIFHMLATWLRRRRAQQ